MLPVCSVGSSCTLCGPRWVFGLRIADVNSLRGVVHPAQQWPDKPLMTGGSAQPIPIPQGLALLLSASAQKYPSDMMVSNGAETDRCGPWIIERAIRDHVHRAPFAGARLVRSSGQPQRVGDPVEVHFRYFPSPSLLTSTSDPVSSLTSPRRAFSV
jgi:hypothetical protein